MYAPEKFLSGFSNAEPISKNLRVYFVKQADVRNTPFDVISASKSGPFLVFPCRIPCCVGADLWSWWLAL